MSVSVILVTNNSVAALPPFLESLSEQMYDDWKLYVIDQASRDETINTVRSSVPGAIVLRNGRNTGMASGLNQGVRLAMGSDDVSTYFFLADVGTVLHRLCLSQLVESLQSDPSSGIIGPKIFQMFEENILEESLHERVQSDILYSSGVVWKPGSPMVQRGYGEQDGGQFDDSLQVDAVMRQALMIRSDLLQKNRYDEVTFIDPYLISEGEDLDLACRVRKLGMHVMIAPHAHAYRSCGIFRGKRKASSIFRQLFEQTQGVQHMLAVRNSMILTRVHLRWQDRVLKFSLIVFRALRWAIWLLFHDLQALGQLIGSMAHRSHVVSRRRLLRDMASRK